MTRARVVESAPSTRSERAELLALMREELADRLDRVAADVIELGVEQDNEEANALYERLGFEVAKVLPELGFEIMTKRLSGA